MNTLEVVFVFGFGFISALPMTLLFAASMRRSDIRNRRPTIGDSRRTVSPDAIYVDGKWQKCETL